jgi:hypothetical protein
MFYLDGPAFNIIWNVRCSYPAILRTRLLKEQARTFHAIYEWSDRFIWTWRAAVTVSLSQYSGKAVECETGFRLPEGAKIRKIWGFHCGDYEECRLLGCYAVWLL